MSDSIGIEKMSLTNPTLYDNHTEEAKLPAAKAVKESAKFVKFEHKLCVGALAGIAGTSVVYPMDIIKTQLQSRKPIAGQSLLQATTAVMQNITNRNGFRGLYRGFSACLVGIAPEKALKLAVNDAARDFFEARSTDGSIHITEEIMSGSIAGLVQTIVTVPYEMVKIRLQMQTNAAAEARLSALQIIENLGPTGMYRGLTATIFRDVPFCFIFFPLYSNIKALLRKISNHDPSKPEPFVNGLISGMVAGAISGGLVTPADMLKTRIQQKNDINIPFFEYGRKVAREEGFMALFRGWHTRMLVIAPLYGLVSFAFEVQKHYLLQSSSS